MPHHTAAAQPPGGPLHIRREGSASTPPVHLSSSDERYRAALYAALTSPAPDREFRRERWRERALTVVALLGGIAAFVGLAVSMYGLADPFSIGGLR